MATERDRIARDLHDVIAHSVSVMTVQAGAARMQLPDHPDRAVPPLVAVEETGRQALAEMRSLLGILREDGAPALAPQPCLTDLPALAESVRQAGVEVEITVEGSQRLLPAGVDLTAYRIVQESLTNTLKHAGPARAKVVVRYDADALCLDITDDGPGLTRSGPRVRPRAARNAGAGEPVRWPTARRPRPGQRFRGQLPAPHRAATVIRVVVADGQALVRGAFRLILETQPDIEVVGEAADGREAVQRVRELRPYVVLMDIRMPGPEGLEATRRLMATADPPRVLMLTPFDLDEYVYDALRAGASGFLLKDVRPEQLADALRAVAAGGTLLATVITRRLVER